MSGSPLIPVFCIWTKLCCVDLGQVSDVVPVACRAAADAGIRSVCVTNFRWPVHLFVSLFVCVLLGATHTMTLYKRLDSVIVPSNLILLSFYSIGCNTRESLSSYLLQKTLLSAANILDNMAHMFSCILQLLHAPWHAALLSAIFKPHNSAALSDAYNTS
jgi:hypothetical protein